MKSSKKSKVRLIGATKARFRRFFRIRVQRQKRFDEPGGSQDSGSLIKAVPSTQLDAIKKRTHLSLALKLEPAER